MILFFRVFLLLFCFLSFSQGFKTEPLLVKKDSVSFYSFSEKSVSYFRFNDQNKLIEKSIDYNKPLPKSLDSDLIAGLSAVSKKGVVYLLYPGGGVLYQFIDNAIERIDESFAHRSQFSGHFFMYKENLYLLGGYGYWKSSSSLTKFDFQSGSWDLISTFGQVPPEGIDQGSFVVKENILSVFDFYETAAETSTLNPNLFTLNLDTFMWSKKGALNSLFKNDIRRSILLAKLPYKESLITKAPWEHEFQIVSPSLNSIKTYKTNDLSQMSNNSIVVGDRVVYFSRDAKRTGYTVVFKTLSDLLLLPSEELLYNDTFAFKVYGFFAVSLLFILLLAVFVYFKRSAKAFFLSANSLSFEEKSIAVNTDERYFLKLLVNSKKGTIDNSLILSYFKNGTTSLDAAIKRKNKMIDLLNKKFFDCFEAPLINKASGLKDSREVFYILNSSIKVFVKES
jgi:hypothetical protein